MPLVSAPSAAARTRIKLEAMLRAVTRDSDAGILVLDPKHRVNALNPAAERLLSVRIAAVRGKPGSSLLRTVVAGDDPVLDSFRVARLERDTVLVNRDGAEIPVVLRSVRFGRPAWVVIMLRDLTQMRRMQHELRRNERLATLGQLSAGVAHEIRNPLAGIGTSAQVLLRRFEPRDDRARFVQVILDEVGRLDRIVTNLLQYARPRTPELKPGDLPSCVARVRELTAEAVAAGGIKVECDTGTRLGPIWLDNDLVTQVLLNVTLNAIQAMPNGGTLRYEIRQVRRRRPPRGAGRRADDPSRRSGAEQRKASSAAGWIEYQQVRVIDTGVGIPRHALSKMFDPFFSTRPGGTGLGLSICQTIMQEHGSAIEVASREGRGTTVLLSFPVEKRNGERRESSRNANPTHAARR
jgi:two-component system sensor histidine kinase HydH